MHNAVSPYGQGAPSSILQAPFSQNDISSPNGVSTTTSTLRQFRVKKDNADKQQHHSQDNCITSNPSENVSRLPPTHYPPHPPLRSNEYYNRYNQQQYPDYSTPLFKESQQMKYTDLSDHQPIQHDASVLQKQKEYREMVMKHSYPDPFNGQQSYPSSDPSNLHNPQFMPKEAQIHPSHPSYKPPESQLYQKDLPYSLQMPKYNIPSQIRKYGPGENDFLSKLHRCNPSMARSIVSDHQLRESQNSYPLDPSRMYNQNQRYYQNPLQNTPPYHSNNYGIPQPYNYSGNNPNCNYGRSSGQIPRYSPVNPLPGERSMSPSRRSNYPEMSVNYGTMPQKISPTYHQCGPEYAQHYQHRVNNLPPQDYYVQQCRSQFLPNNNAPSEEIQVTPASTDLKRFIENWADDENPPEASKDNSAETVYIVNPGELQYLDFNAENIVPGQYIIKSGVIENNSALRIVESNKDVSDNDKVLNLQVVNKQTDCMLEKPQDLTDTDSNSKVVIHSNTIVKSASTLEKSTEETSYESSKVDKNCSPINIQGEKEDEARPTRESVILSNKLEEASSEEKAKIVEDSPKTNSPNAKACESKDMPVIDFGDEPSTENGNNSTNENISKPPESPKETKIDDSPKKTEDSSAEEPVKLEKEENVETEEEMAHESEETTVVETKLEETVNEEIKQVTTDLSESVKSEIETEESLRKTLEESDKVEETIETPIQNLVEEILEKNKQEKLTHKPVKNTTKRSRRIFSVDDIINNIGNKKNKENKRRRKSIQITEQFLEKEKEGEKHVDMSITPVGELGEKENEPQIEKVEEKEKKPLESTENHISSSCNDDMEITATDCTDIEKSVENVCENNVTDIKENDAHIEEISSNSLNEKINSNEEINAETQEKEISSSDTVNSSTQECLETAQFRSAIKIEENNVLLHIAGELIEINVNHVNGKKVITVVPISDTTIVDFNDNYETMNLEENSEEIIESEVVEDATETHLIENLEIEEELSKMEEEKPDNIEKEVDNDSEVENIKEVEQTEILEEIKEVVDNIVGETIIEEISDEIEPLLEETISTETSAEEKSENIEENKEEKLSDIIKEIAALKENKAPTTNEEIFPEENDFNEIIIGDESLELEVELDLQSDGRFNDNLSEEKSNVALCTKAAKKSYDNAIVPPKQLRKQTPRNGKTVQNSDIKRSKRILNKKEGNKGNKKSFDELIKIRNIKKTKTQQKVEDDEEYVSFKELVKARKLKKKLKLEKAIKSEETKPKTEGIETKIEEIQPKIEEIKTKTEEVPNKKEEVEVKEEKPINALKQVRLPVRRNNKLQANKTIEKSEEKDKIIEEEKEKTEIVPVTKEEIIEKPKIKEAEVKEAPEKVPESILKKPTTVKIIRKVSFSDETINKQSSPKDQQNSPEDFASKKKRLSLQDYNNRKRKKSVDIERPYRSPDKPLNIEIRVYTEEVEEKDSPIKEEKQCKFISFKRDSIHSEHSVEETVKNQRPQLLDDSCTKTTKENVLVKRKMSIEETQPYPQFNNDWEETESPKDSENRLEEDTSLTSFESFIDNKNSNKVFIDVNELEAKADANKVEKDELQIYKEQVDSKLSSLNLVIPKFATNLQITKNQKISALENRINNFSLTHKDISESHKLMSRFLNKEYLTEEEMGKIKLIIQYKRMIQTLKKMKSGEDESPLNPSYEIHKEEEERELKLHLKKLPEENLKRRKRRFRNLHTQNTSDESDSDFASGDNSHGDYSVVQAKNSQFSGVPKLIIKRKIDLREPVVRLERLDMNSICSKKRKS